MNHSLICFLPDGFEFVLHFDGNYMRDARDAFICEFNMEYIELISIYETIVDCGMEKSSWLCAITKPHSKQFGKRARRATSEINSISI